MIGTTKSTSAPAPAPDISSSAPAPHVWRRRYFSMHRPCHTIAWIMLLKSEKCKKNVYSWLLPLKAPENCIFKCALKYLSTLKPQFLKKCRVYFQYNHKSYSAYAYLYRKFGSTSCWHRGSFLLLLHWKGGIWKKLF